MEWQQTHGSREQPLSESTFANMMGGPISYGNYMTIKCPDIANGPGCRLSLFLSGCSRRCPGCFNKEAWDYNAGQMYDSCALGSAMKRLLEPHITGITILGGEPMDSENILSTYITLLSVKSYCMESVGPSDIHIETAVYTGYTFEELMERIAAEEDISPTNFSIVRRVLELTDILVDGPFVQELHDISLRFRGSSNQRILDMKKSLDAKHAVWTTDPRWIGEPVD